MHIFIPWRKHMQSFKMIRTKLKEELRSQDIQGKCWRKDERTDGRTKGRKLARLSRPAKERATKTKKNKIDR